MPDLFSVLEDLSSQLPGCRMASIVDLETGMQLASVSDDQTTHSAGADAFQSELFRRCTELVELLDSQGPTESLVLEADGLTFVSEPIGDSGYFWHVATDANTTLGFTQAIMRKFRTRVADSLQELVAD